MQWDQRLTEIFYNNCQIHYEPLGGYVRSLSYCGCNTSINRYQEYIILCTLAVIQYFSFLHN